MMIQQTFSLAALGAMALVSSLGCIVGPGSIAAGRSVYNNVINSTENDQLLNMIVRDRYGETYGMLTVASDAGANAVNDTSALRDDGDMAAVIADSGAGLVLMHRQGAPAQMQSRFRRCARREHSGVLAHSGRASRLAGAACARGDAAHCTLPR